MKSLALAQDAEVGTQLSVIIVNFNAGSLLIKAVDAVLTSCDSVEVLVSDNGSSDDSLSRLDEHCGHDPRLNIIRNQANLGFARANNRALEQAVAPYLLFLNPDCIVGSRTLPRMLQFMKEHPHAGMAGCVTRNPDGSEQIASRRVIPNPWIALASFTGVYRLWPGLARQLGVEILDQALPPRPTPVDAISGAFMLVRRSALEEVGPLDEGYFLHCEDLDWFVRFARSGWTIYFVPDADVVHYKGSCSVGHGLSVAWHKHRGMSRFFHKFQSRNYPRPFSLLVHAGIWFHFGLWLAVQPLRWAWEKAATR
jgi:GT2 family glycosyltransferase